MVVLLPVVVIGGYFYPYIGFVVVVLICCFVVLSFFRGRFYCGWFCPMGSFHERVLSKISFKREVPQLFRRVWFRWFVFIIMMSLLVYRLFNAGSNSEKIAEVFRFMWIVSTSIAIVIGIVFKPRIWCRICPMGSMQGVLSKKTYLLSISDDCKECKLCKKVCPVSSEPYKNKEKGFLSSEECLRCFNCIENCPKNALTFSNKNSIYSK